MKRSILSIVICLLCMSFLHKEEKGYRYVKNNSFTTGERLEYRVHLGFLSGAYATMEIGESVHMINNRPCYKVNVFGKTAGMIDFFYKVRDNWGSYIDTSAIVPQRFYRYIRENKYRKNEIVDFNHNTDTAIVARLDKKTKAVIKRDKYSVSNNIQDLVSGYYYLRTMNLNKLKKGDVVKIEGFFDDEIYNLEVKYEGSEKLKTKLGEFNAHVFIPKMPKNKLFPGKDPIKLWISKDTNKIPLKIEAKMRLGVVEVDLKSYENLRN